jgi:S-adenosyl-L-methionine hydrolase (adenosine-forming)
MLTVTFTTDFGTRDHYAAVLKAAILQRQPAVQLVDVTHEIESFDILRAAFLIKNAWFVFPKGTVHILAVNNFYDPDFRFLAVRHEAHFFLAPDNGVLSLIFENLKVENMRVLDFQTESPFALRDVFADAVAHISLGLDFENIGSPVENFAQRIHFQPVTTPNFIRGAVMHIDQFENVVLNVSRETFEKVGNGRNFSLYFRRNDPIKVRSKNYCDVPIGEPLCLFNSSGMLEVAINMGRAASLLNLKLEDLVQIDFH